MAVPEGMVEAAFFLFEMPLSNLEQVTVELLRKRAEHNNCEVLTLEEISLHQQEIERIEYLDKVCRDLKILYLQSNLIPKIENVGKLKKLEYLNLALNNITTIENLEGCESLRKLDFTVNFIAELTSIETLRGNYHLRELFLTGNPCTDYEGYREFVIATLDQLEWLDGKQIEKSERILAKQDYEVIRANIVRQQEEYTTIKRKEAEEKSQPIEKQEGKQDSGGTWYTDIPGSSKGKTPEEDEADEKRYWQESEEYTPESRVRLHKHIEERRKERQEKDDERLGQKKAQRKVRYFADDGRVLNINQGKWEFSLSDDEDNNQFLLDLHCYRHLDTSLIDADVQPNYIRITIKEKVFQLALSEEVNSDASTAKRSQTTGHLLVTMPKVKQVLRPLKQASKPEVGVNKTERGALPEEQAKRNCTARHEKLEVNPTLSTGMDFSNIVKDKKQSAVGLKQEAVKDIVEENSEDFIDDPDVPPLM